MGEPTLLIIFLVSIFVSNLLASFLIGLLGNLIVSVICGMAAGYFNIFKKETVAKKLLQLFSFLAALEAATVLCLTVLDPIAKFIDDGFPLIGLSISVAAFIVGWILNKILTTDITV